MKHTLSILLQNEAGALVRVAGLFSARGFNIDSLTVAATQDPAVSRLTLVMQGADDVVDQLIKQTRKLVDVIEVSHPQAEAAGPEALQ
jgi:acetolactate synthase-1/3 small subunit